MVAVRRLFAGVLLAALLPATARAQEATNEDLARAHSLLGEAAYAEARYADALREFRAAYALDARPALLYNVAMCHERIGDLPAAIDGFERYLAADSTISDRTLVERRVDRLREELRARGAAGPPKPAIVAPASVAPTPSPSPLGPPPPARAATPVYKKGWFWAVVIGSAALVAVGVGLGVGLSQGGDSSTNLTTVTLR
jgi:tetratricopeptide (TPR) repeat protein